MKLDCTIIHNATAILPDRLLPDARVMRLATVCLLAFGTALGAADSSPSVRPNIVFIMADDLGWADVAFHGGNAPTPHLDRLAREGLELAQHYVAPVCSPTRTGLMTGRCWSRFNVTNPQNERALPWDTVTLPRVLKAAGYDTCLAGKWHLGSLPSQGPNHFGFDHSYGSLAGGVSPYGHRYKQGAFSETWHRNEKLIVSGPEANRPAELFDLATDPAEKNNLAAAQPDRHRQMQALLDRAAARDRDAVAKD